MKKIVNLIGINSKYVSDKLYGVEIEVEGKHLPNPDNTPGMWRVERDSSLKTAEAWEYVMKGPEYLTGVKGALDALQGVYNALGSQVHDSVRAGVHVHMNVQKWNIKQLLTFSICYYVLEDHLLRWCGENREGNLFCLRTRDAEYVLFQILKVLTERNIKYLQNDIIRYSSLNYCSLFKYGTIEFRGMRGTPDLETIFKWVQMIDELRTTSQGFGSPVEVLDFLSGSGEEDLMKTLLPSFYKDLVAKDSATVIRNSARRVQMIAYGIDWAALEKPRVNPFEIEKGGL